MNSLYKTTALLELKFVYLHNLVKIYFSVSQLLHIKLNLIWFVFVNCLFFCLLILSFIYEKNYPYSLSSLSFYLHSSVASFILSYLLLMHYLYLQVDQKTWSNDDTDHYCKNKIRSYLRARGILPKSQGRALWETITNLVSSRCRC